MMTILTIGEDSLLLKTRAEVLSKSGSNVVCSNSASALKFIEEWEFDLVVLCHSVGRAEAMQITDAAHHQGSKTLV